MDFLWARLFSLLVRFFLSLHSRFNHSKQHRVFYSANCQRCKLESKKNTNERIILKTIKKMKANQSDVEQNKNGSDVCCMHSVWLLRSDWIDISIRKCVWRESVFGFFFLRLCWHFNGVFIDSGRIQCCLCSFNVTKSQ